MCWCFDNLITNNLILRNVCSVLVDVVYCVIILL